MFEIADRQRSREKPVKHIDILHTHTHRGREIERENGLTREIYVEVRGKCKPKIRLNNVASVLFFSLFSPDILAACYSAK